MLIRLVCLFMVGCSAGWRYWCEATPPRTWRSWSSGALLALCLGGPTARPAAEAAAWLLGLLAVTIPAAVTRYRHATST
jgi:hypothetical protein